MMNIIQKITLLSLISVSLNVFGQESGLGYKTAIHKIYSEDQDEYILKITFPRDYNSDTEYKTMYYLDAYWLTDITLGCYTILDLCKNVEDVVFVGISINGTEKDWNKQRNMDFTPSPYQNLGIKKSNPENNKKIVIKDRTGNQINKENTGGASLFLEFLENDIIKFVEREYPNVNKRKGLLGHSFGGLFGFYTLQNRPDLFQDFLIISAAVTWNSYELVDDSKFLKLKGAENNLRIYHSYGEQEISSTRNSNTAIRNIITELKLEKLDYEFSPIKNTNHYSVLSRAIYDGLLHLYKK
jgi:predicted alpha/beta superfamily hydrolase